MNITSMVAQQVFIMLIIIVLGYVLTKKNVVTEAGTKDMSSILLNIVIPCLVVQSYQTDCDKGIIKELIVAFLLSLLLHILYIMLSVLVFKKEMHKEKKKVNIYTSIYSNCGFMGIPLLAATLGSKGVIIGSTYLAMFNLFAWTHGLYLYGEDIKLLSAKKLVKNAGVIGVVTALLLFFLNIRIQEPLKGVIGYIASLNTPLSMILLGSYLAKSNLAEALKTKGLYTALTMRLIVLPILSILIFKLLSVDEFMGASIILCAACPSAAMGAIVAEKFNMDASYPSQIISVSTILSILTLPLMSFIISYLL